MSSLEKHEYRPFTTRDGSKACAECNGNEHAEQHVEAHDPVGDWLSRLGDIDQERERLGRLVRELWIDWAKKQPAPKPSWLVPFDELSEPDKEADRVIGYGLLLEFNSEMTGERMNHERLKQIAEDLRTQLHGFRQLFDENDPESGRAIAAFDEFIDRPF